MFVMVISVVGIFLGDVFWCLELFRMFSNDK